MTAIDGRIYVDGRPTPCPPDLEDAADDLERSGGVAWIGLMDPGADELEAAAARVGLHPLAVEDAHPLERLQVAALALTRRSGSTS
ncbi:hypothetical protein ACPXCP_09760 [Streptomyces sp. DT20]|uniref:hypothetical protein n=1 Tax=unclassified Streptomyces TaxID=2593676 RepID=UPI002E2CF3C6|nr:hypothetical protein [Streptomyces sp. NBC_00304]